MGVGVRVEMFGPVEEKFILVLVLRKESDYGYQITTIRLKGQNL